MANTSSRPSLFTATAGLPVMLPPKLAQSDQVSPPVLLMCQSAPSPPTAKTSLEVTPITPLSSSTMTGSLNKKPPRLSQGDQLPRLEVCAMCHRLLSPPRTNASGKLDPLTKTAAFPLKLPLTPVHSRPPNPEPQVVAPPATLVTWKSAREGCEVSFWVAVTV